VPQQIEPAPVVGIGPADGLHGRALGGRPALPGDLSRQGQRKAGPLREDRQAEERVRRVEAEHVEQGRSQVELRAGGVGAASRPRRISGDVQRSEDVVELGARRHGAAPREVPSHQGVIGREEDERVARPAGSLEPFPERSERGVPGVHRVEQCAAARARVPAEGGVRKVQVGRRHGQQERLAKLPFVDEVRDGGEKVLVVQPPGLLDRMPGAPPQLGVLGRVDSLVAVAAEDARGTGKAREVGLQVV